MMNRVLLILGFIVLPLAGLSSGLQEQLAAESQRRELAIRPLQQALAQGEQLAKQGETLRAWEGLVQVWQQTPESLQETALGQKVRQVLAAWEVSLGEGEMVQSRWPKAREWAVRALQHDPNNAGARGLLENADAVLRRGAVAGEEVNPALTDRFFKKLQGVRDGLKKAEQLRETGQLDQSEARYEEVLRLDPFNSVATEGIRKIYEERALVADKSRSVSNLERRREVREAWNNIYPKKTAGQGGTQVTGPLTASPTFVLEQKLRNIRIPQVDFAGADLETIRRALNTLSRQYDTDAGKAGVNFVVSADVVNPQPVNLKLRDVSLEEVVRYVAQIAGVKSRLGDVGVTFSPLVETRPDLIPREFTVSPSFFKEAGTSETAQAVPRGGAATDGADAGGSGRATGDRPVPPRSAGAGARRRRRQDEEVDLGRPGA
jgi:tetratricopeptide (TPR) repeat protein